MKVLSTAWTVFEKDGRGISKNGGSIAIYNICEYIGRIAESFLFVGNKRTKGYLCGNFHVVDNTECLPSVKTADNIFLWQDGLKKSFKDILINEEPDIVFIHGGGEFSENCIHVCIESNQKYAFVDHSYFGSGAEKYGGEEMVEWEKRVFSIPNLYTIMVGNGMRNHMLKDFPNFLKKNVITIVNGTHFSYEMKSCNIRKQYHIEEKKVLACVGRIYKRKNQIQLTRIFKHLPEKIKKELVIVVCGVEPQKIPGMEDLINAIKKEKVENKVICIGELDEEGMKGLYSTVDGLIMPSMSEGLSLVALEMLVYGKPVIMFSDNETAVDVCDPCAVVLAEDRSDASLARAVEEWYDKDWDQEKIHEYATYFSMERVAQDYVAYCSRRISEEV